MPFVRQKRERASSNERMPIRSRRLLYHKRHRKGHFDSGTIVEKSYACGIRPQQLDDVSRDKVKSDSFKINESIY